MAYNYDINSQYYYPATYQLHNTYATQYVPQSYNYSYFNGYQNLLRNLQNREVTMEYWSRQLQYFRNLLKNFSAQIETPEDLKKLLATCNYDRNIKKCFEKRRTFFNIDKNCNECCCDFCLKKKLLELCDALSIPWPCNKCTCSACQSRLQKPCCEKHSCTYNYENSPGYCYVPWQANNQIPTPAYSYYYYPCQTPAPPNYCQTMPQQFHNNNCCPPNCEMCCDKCKFKNIINQINYILSSAEQLQNVPCACNCACSMPPRKPCCVINEIKEETVTIKLESAAENDPNKNKTNALNKTAQSPDLAKPECAVINQKITETDNNLSSPENSDANTYKCEEVEKCLVPVSSDPQSESRKCSFESRKYQSESETIDDDASNLSEECKNFSTCDNKQASILLGEEYISPSGTFKILIEDEQNRSDKKTCKHKKNKNSNLTFLVDYKTYTKPKCNVDNEF